MYLYKFPEIHTINDVIPYIKDHDEFGIIEKNDMIIVHYFIKKNNTFVIDPDNPIKGIMQRECRGLLFNKNGEIIGRRYHKIFNLGELKETLEMNVDLNKPHRILEKLDGSMVSPVLINGEPVLTTKLGITEHSKRAQHFLETQPNIKKFCLEVLMNGYNPIFEWLDEKFVHQIKHQKSDLVLTAIRGIKTGIYVGYTWFRTFRDKYNISIVKYLGVNRNIANLYEQIKKMENTEGIVTRFDNGHMIKIKTDWYLERAKLFDMIRFEKDIIALIASQKDDDIIGLLEENIREKYINYRNIVLNSVEKWAEKIENHLETFLNNHKPENRKQFYEIISNKIDKQVLPYYLKFIGDTMEGKKIKSKLFDYMLNRLVFYSSTTTRLNNVKWIYKEDWVRYL